MANQFDFSSMKKNLNVAIWRYTDSTRNSGGLHISAGEESKNRFASLLDFVIENTSGKHITIDLVDASKDITDVPNFGCNVQSFNKLKLITTEMPQKIHINGNDVFFELSKENFSKISQCIRSIRSGYEKNIMIEGEVLNFWWQLLK